MAADVSMQIKNNKSGLITRDFLGVGCFGIDSKELDLDLHVPNGWEKRLDLKSGKVYIQRSNNPANSASEQKKMATNNKENSTKPQDFNVFQQSSSSSSNTKPTLGLLEQQPSLDLKLIPNNNNTNNNPPSTHYTSVCTLDKVKSALDRAERASPTLSSSSTSSSSSSKKRWMMMSSCNVRSSSPSNSLSLSIGEEERDSSRLSNSLLLDHSNDQGLLVAAACPACLLYVLISKNDPKCPKCNSLVHLPTMNKKPKIDLNMSI